MKVINYWEHFLTTGSVSDYLNYLGSCRQDMPAEPAEERTSEKAGGYAGYAKEAVNAKNRQNKGAGKVEGTDQRYRDNIESGTHRGI